MAKITKEQFEAICAFIRDGAQYRNVNNVLGTPEAAKEIVAMSIGMAEIGFELGYDVLQIHAKLVPEWILE